MIKNIVAVGWVIVLLTGVTWAEAPVEQQQQFNNSSSQNLKIATWNMEWLMTPATYDALKPHCTEKQPGSNQRAFPCTPGRPPIPRHSEEDFEAMARYATLLDADVVGVQEVDGAEPAAKVFGESYQVDCFINRQHPQKTGFAIRKSIPYRCNVELSALDFDNSSRAGADITLYPDTPNAIRLLAVHLKSGCFDQRLDNTSNNACPALRRQIPLLEAWMDARVLAGEQFAILGDFNRRLEKDAHYPAGNNETQPLNIIAALSDNNPPGATLIRSTENAPFIPCSSKDNHDPDYIDGLLLSQKLAAAASERIFFRQPYNDEEARRLVLSDHCPTGLILRNVLH